MESNDKCYYAYLVFNLVKGHLKSKGDDAK